MSHSQLAARTCPWVSLLLTLRSRLCDLRPSVTLDGLAGTLAGCAVAALLEGPLTELLEERTNREVVLLRQRPPPCSSLTSAARSTVRLPVSRRLSLPGTGSLAVLLASCLGSVGVLASAPPMPQHPLPGAFALASLAACAVRLALAFLLLRELADVRVQAMTDELTGAPNRRALYAELDQLFGLPTDDRRPSAGFGFALVDLDHFKEVNDSFGHAVGDELLRQVVRRFTEALQGTPHLLARLGGDEFAVVLRSAGSCDQAVACADALQDALQQPVVIDDVQLHVQASIGVALAPEHGQSRSDVLFAADAAMYAAKTSGEPVRVYSPVEVGGRRTRLEVAEALFSALDRHELTVEYQPIMTVCGQLVGAEALVRWDHPIRGRISPEEFLEVAERHRMTPCIAERVLDVALADLHRWRAAGLVLRTSVNVSATDLRDEELVDTVAAALLRHDVPSSALTIEITETAMMRDPEKAQAVMAALSELGVDLSVDDYGTGYSSLEYLLRLPIDEIKLDRAFSTDLVSAVRSVAIVRSTVDLTHALGLRMVAEGVEDPATLAILRDLGCDLVQGWHLGRPMSAEAFERFVEASDAGRHHHTGAVG